MVRLFALTYLDQTFLQSMFTYVVVGRWKGTSFYCNIEVSVLSVALGFYMLSFCVVNEGVF